MVRLELAIKNDIDNLSTSEEDTTEMTSSLRERLSELSILIKELETLGLEQDLESVQALVLSHVSKHKEERKILSVSLREATMRWRAALEKRHQKERQELLSGAEMALTRQKERQRADVLSQSVEVTSRLRAVRKTMSNEVQHGHATLRALVESSEAISRIDTELETYGSAVGIGRSILRRLKRRDVVDRILIGLGFLFFVSVVIYVTKRRLGAIVNIFWPQS